MVLPRDTFIVINMCRTGPLGNKTTQFRAAFYFFRRFDNKVVCNAKLAENLSGVYWEWQFLFLSRQGLIFQVLLGKTLGTVVKFSSLRYSHWSAKQLSTGRTSDICIEWSPVLISYFPKLARAQLSLQQTRGTPEHPASSLYCPHGSYNLFKAHLWP